jgi:hypothetical protein
MSISQELFDMKNWTLLGKQLEKELSNSKLHGEILDNMTRYVKENMVIIKIQNGDKEESLMLDRQNLKTEGVKIILDEIKIPTSDLDILWGDTCYVYHGELLLREYEIGSGYITCYFEKEQRWLTAKDRAIMHELQKEQKWLQSNLPT